jgi:branched-chain amino acid transport system substrate-binding protein
MQSHGIGNQVFLDTGRSGRRRADRAGRPARRRRPATGERPAEGRADDVRRRTTRRPTTRRPSTFAGHAWDAFQLAVDAFKAVGTDKQKVRDHLEQVKGFVGITGVFTMTPQDHSGLGKEALVLVTVSGSKWQLAPA